VAASIALKNSDMVDFPKTGILPEPFTKEESLTWWPDYMQKASHMNTYTSERLLGQAYRFVLHLCAHVFMMLQKDDVCPRSDTIITR
jgi:hypothetical protein